LSSSHGILLVGTTLDNSQDSIGGSLVFSGNGLVGAVATSTDDEDCATLLLLPVVTTLRSASSAKMRCIDVSDTTTVSMAANSGRVQLTVLLFCGAAGALVWTRWAILRTTESAAALALLLLRLRAAVAASWPLAVADEEVAEVCFGVAVTADDVRCVLLDDEDAVVDGPLEKRARAGVFRRAAAASRVRRLLHRPMLWCGAKECCTGSCKAKVLTQALMQKA
jgi:hypothetical protein